MSSLYWVLSGVTALSGIVAAVAVPVCRTIRHNKRAKVFERTFDKLISREDVSATDALNTLQATMGLLEQGPPESDAPNLRTVEAVGNLAKKALPPARRRRQQPGIEPGPDQPTAA